MSLKQGEQARNLHCGRCRASKAGEEGARQRGGGLVQFGGFSARSGLALRGGGGVGANEAHGGWGWRSQRGQAGGTGVGAQKGHPGAPTDRGRSNTDTQNAGATPGGTKASTADKEEGRSKAGEATRTGNQNAADGRACAWEAATTKGMAWPASPVATGCQGNPCSTGIRWGVSPAAQMGCLRSRSGSPSGADQP